MISIFSNFKNSSTWKAGTTPIQVIGAPPQFFPNSPQGLNPSSPPQLPVPDVNITPSTNIKKFASSLPSVFSINHG